MDHSAIDIPKTDAYAKQVKKAWGETDAYREFAEKSKRRTAEEENSLGNGLMTIFAELGEIKNKAPEGEKAQALVKKLQDYITEHYYRCTDQILLGLGQMYAADRDFAANIDAAGGKGTAVFAKDAIIAYCAHVLK